MDTHTDRRAMIAAAAGAGTLALLSRRAAAGPLSPPAGPVSSTGRTTDAIQDAITTARGSRTPINTLPPIAGYLHAITQPGSYVLTEDLFTGGDSAIRVEANDVDIDLNGFMIADLGNNAPSAVRVDATNSNVRVHNGSIFGFSIALRPSNNATVDHMIIEGFSSGSVLAFDDCRISHCVCRGGAASQPQVNMSNRGFITESLFSGAAGVSAGGMLHVDRCQFEDIVGATRGVVGTADCRIANSIVRGFSSVGIEVRSGSVVEGCVLNNNGNGIEIEDYSTVRGNIIDFHPNGDAVYINGSHSRVVDNHIVRAATGIRVNNSGINNIGHDNTLTACNTNIAAPINNHFPLVTRATMGAATTPFVNIDA